MVAASSCEAHEGDGHQGEGHRTLSRDSAARRSSLIRIAAGALVVWLAFIAEPSAGVLALVAFVAAAILLWPTLEASGERLRTQLVTLLALVSLTLSVSGELPEFATSWKVRVWNVYHYYMGAKYFEELGYTDLYDATLQADSEGENYWRDIRRVRNLRTYEKEERALRGSPYDPAAAFDPERWQEFQRDVEALSRQRSPKAWRGIFVDRGYNASPVWTVVGGALAKLAPADRPIALKILCSLDLLLLAATFWLIWRTFGGWAAALVLLLLTLSPVNSNRFVGGFLQYDWFCAVAASACFYRRKRLVVAAGAMSYAVLTRIFPLLFVVAGLVPIVATWWRTRRIPRPPMRFAIAFVGWCFVGLLVSLANGRGVDGWREFVSGIRVHKEHHAYGERRVGLQHLLTHEIGSLEIDESRAERKAGFEHQKGVYYAAAAGLTAFFLYVAARQRSWNARLLGLVPIFVVFVTSRYYWAYLALLPLGGGRRGPPRVRARWLSAAQLLVFAGFYTFQTLNSEHYAGYIVFGALLLVYLVFALAVLAPSGYKGGR